MSLSRIHLHIRTDTIFVGEAVNDDLGMRATLDIRESGACGVCMFLDLHDIARMIAALEDLRQKVAELGKGVEDDAGTTVSP